MDPIADMITRIRNAAMVKKPVVKIPFSKIKWEILNVLSRQKFIGEVRKIGKNPKKMIEVKLLYQEDGTPKFNEIKRISKPSLRIYKKAKELWPVKGGLGIQVISTSQGIMSQDEAKKKNLGGEVLIEIW